MQKLSYLGFKLFYISQYAYLVYSSLPLFEQTDLLQGFQIPSPLYLGLKLFYMSFDCPIIFENGLLSQRLGLSRLEIPLISMARDAISPIFASKTCCRSFHASIKVLDLHKGLGSSASSMLVGSDTKLLRTLVEDLVMVLDASQILQWTRHAGSSNYVLVSRT